MRKVFFLSAAILFLRMSAYACSTIYVPPASFNPDEFIFIGEVAGYTGALYSDSLERSFQGLRILIKDFVYLPVKNPKVVDIIPYDLGPACELMSTDEKSLEYRYPPGTQLRIVGTKSVYIKNPLSDIPILDINPFKYTLSKSFVDPPVLYSTLSSVYDYRNSTQDSINSFKQKVSHYGEEWAQELVNSYAVLFHYELCKDLYRLANASSDEEKSNIITRLINFRSYRRDSLLVMIGNNIKDSIVKYDIIKLVDKMHPKITEPPFDTSLHNEVPESMTAGWIQTNGPYGGTVGCIAGSKIDNKEILLLAGTSRNGIFRSTNKGKNWIRTGNRISDQKILTLFMCGKDMYAGTDSGAIKSTDFGITWNYVKGGLPTDKMTYCNSFTANSKYLFAGFNSQGAFRSSDNGQNWEAINSGLEKNSANCLLSYEKYLFAGTFDGIFVSTDNGSHWRPINRDFPVRHYPNNPKSVWFPISTIHMSRERLFIGTDFNGLYLSTDFGETWEEVNPVFNRTRIYSVTGNFPELFVSTESGIYYSKNNGEDWTPANNEFLRGVHCFTLLDQNNELYAATERGIFVSKDKGKRWNEINTGIKNTEVHLITSCRENLLGMNYQMGIYSTSDDGKNWKLLTDNIYSREFRSLAAIGQTIFCATFDGLYSTSNDGNDWSKVLDSRDIRHIYAHNNLLFIDSGRDLLCSADTGRHWSLCVHGFSVGAFGSMGEVSFIATANRSGMFSTIGNCSDWEISGKDSLLLSRYIKSFASSGNRLYALTEGYGVIMSVDSGKTWEEQTDSIYFYQFDDLAVYKNYMFAATRNLGVVFSNDEGKTWIPFNYKLRDKRVLSLYIKDDILYAGTTSGVWKHPLAKD